MRFHALDHLPRFRPTFRSTSKVTHYLWVCVHGVKTIKMVIGAGHEM